MKYEIAASILAFALSSCSTGTQATGLRVPDSTDSGSENSTAGDQDAGSASRCTDGGTAYCPGDRDHFCRLRAYADDLSSPCAADGDCIFAESVPQPENCLSFGVCSVERPSILAIHGQEWTRGALEEMRAYCPAVSCRIAAQCVVDDGYVPRCVGGRCGRGAP